MQVRIISKTDIHEYSRLLTADEIFGIEDGRFTSFAAFGKEREEPAGILTVQILPEYIRLERIFVRPEFRRMGFASGLLRVIKDRPGDARLPIRAFLEEEEDVLALLKARGFEEKKNGYSVITGRIRDWIDLEPRIKELITADIRKTMKASWLDQWQEDALRDFILNSPHDELLQFPDKTMDLGRFSEASVICRVGDAIKAALLMEEREDDTQLTWCYGEEMAAIYVCLSLARLELEKEYGPDGLIRCLSTADPMEKAYKKLFAEYDRTAVKILEFL
ncbi:MAG: GNAT family N-acetyltransferase [Lachnospiraceae bacterium]|nr:GNAT family N-acetyltransferase [Lachnospiraceae bacterium]